MMPGFEFHTHILPASFSPVKGQKEKNKNKERNHYVYNSVNDFNASLATALYCKDHCMHTFSSECHC